MTGAVVTSTAMPIERVIGANLVGIAFFLFVVWLVVDNLFPAATRTEEDVDA